MCIRDRSGSILNTDLGIDNYYMYDGYYNQSDGAWWGWRESVSLHSTNSKQGANEDLSFIKRKAVSYTHLDVYKRQPHYREDWAFRTTYNWSDRYFIEYNGAYNGSEKFSKENRFAFFNSGAIGWMVSEEPFMKFLKERRILDMLKIRASYGEIGDDNVKTRWLYMNQWAYGGTSSLDVDLSLIHI